MMLLYLHAITILKQLWCIKIYLLRQSEEKKQINNVFLRRHLAGGHKKCLSDSMGDRAIERATAHLYF